MPRKHVHKLGTPYRRNYSSENMERALEGVIDGQLSFQQAADRFGVPKTTLYNKYRGRSGDKLGRPPVLSILEEKNIVNALFAASSFGYPFTQQVLCEFVQQYLNRKGVHISVFQNNLPGKDWYLAFLERNPELARRLSENIKRSRAQITTEIIEEYFENLKTTLEGVSPKNIINFDETNITDDPGKQKVLVRRGSKHAHRILDSSKASTSVMFCATGDGQLLAPYVVYKAKHLYPEWIQNGPTGTHFNRSSSGWFDGDIFEDWFIKLALPYLKKQEGKKILIGDNCASHLSYEVVKKCEENNISFVFLPPNTTHICQPLDVSVFGPLKKAWRRILTTWKQTNRGVLPKSQFPGMLKKLYFALQPTIKSNIVSGFEGAGIIPCRPERVISKLFDKRNRRYDDEALKNSFEDIIEKHVSTENVPNVKPLRQKKICVAPGKSVSTCDFEINNSSPEIETRLSKSSTSKSSTSRSSTSKTSNNVGNDPEDSASEEIILISVESEDEDEGNEKTESEEEDLNQKQFPKNHQQFSDNETQGFNLENEMFVIVRFLYNQNSKKETIKEFVAKIVDYEKSNVIIVSCLRVYKQTKNVFVFPDVEDVVSINKAQIKCVLPKPIERRGKFFFDRDVL